MLSHLKKEMQKLADPKKAKDYAWFFKTGKGEYSEGDVFFGIVVPLQRKVAAKYRELSLPEIQGLLNSRIHEHRLTALLILACQFKKADEKKKEAIVKLYLANTKNINNWDLVDLSAPKILGEYLLDKGRKPLYRLAKSPMLWERRIAVLSTFAFIKENDFRDSLAIAELLLKDTHDLIHKAAGWMLREIGKRDLNAEENFLKKHYRQMPRTMLRYAIEKFGGDKRAFYMKKD
ncbi:MAG TPA: DNA alkylation repair protein [Nanoarchaeota archaeon]|nr:DNA alkylation repair protein [Nanoarchaeota archaeon]